MTAADRVPGPAELARRAVAVLRERWDVLLVVSVGGVLGSLARWGVAVALPHSGRQFPWATFVVNVLGCLLIGALMHVEERRWSPHRYRRSFLRTGVLGGFTTFSAFGLDAQTLAVAGAGALAAGYVAATLVAGVVAVRAGELAAAAAVAGGHRRDGGASA